MVVESKTPHNMKTIKPFEVKITENHPTEPQIWRVFLDREFTAKLRVIKKDSDTSRRYLFLMQSSKSSILIRMNM